MDTIAAIATPAGVGALGILRLSGPRALEVSRGFLRASSAPGARHATLARADWEGPIDEVLFVYFPGPASATGEDVVEITAHGSPYVLQRLLEASLACGARLAEPGEFSRRAFLNGRMDLTQAEAVCDLIRSRTESAHRAALAQRNGGLSRALEAVRRPLLGLLARVEAGLDHPEEDLPALAAPELDASLEEARLPLSRLAASFARGRLAKDGARVCLVGRPNAGKSSLLNALLGRDRAIVSPEPGTTRDTIEESASLGGVSSTLIDTAGLREKGSGSIELSGMERTQDALASCDVAVLVIDGSRAPSAEDELVHRGLVERAAGARLPVVPVLSKADLARLATWPGALAVSAVAGAGLAELARRIAQETGTATAESPVLVTSLRHRDALAKALEELELAATIRGDCPQDWDERLAHHLRAALSQIDAVTGRAASEDVLDEIFSRFCLGK